MKFQQRTLLCLDIVRTAMLYKQEARLWHQLQAPFRKFERTQGTATSCSKKYAQVW